MCNIYLNNSVIGIFVPSVAQRGRPLTPAGHKRRLEQQAKKAATAKRRQTVANHLMKVYKGKTFTVKDVKKSLALAVRNWQTGCLDAELTVCIQSAGAKIVEKVSAGRGRPANVYSL